MSTTVFDPGCSRTGPDGETSRSASGAGTARHLILVGVTILWVTLAVVEALG